LRELQEHVKQTNFRELRLRADMRVKAQALPGGCMFPTGCDDLWALQPS
jgi:hypothetical protein